MKKISLFFFASMFFILVYVFFNKNYISYDLIYSDLDKEETFSPDAYEFIHSEKDLKSYFNRNSHTREIKYKCKNLKFDFSNYSYAIFYGKGIKSMYYSYKSSFFDDKSPSYARPLNKKVVFVEYEKNNNPSNGLYIYKLKKDHRLRGFYDL